ncbi:unnamed protein product [Nyctereutes procyonoides]|uniref:(raccoon dog) hypothetical protein n=1 Tax=Nyctereutes procyonoides TaxID=34880 RepID=A0A811XU00_NYCPR|nr:unnamed protein product [Nyctereutes procyonoides]
MTVFLSLMGEQKVSRQFKQCHRTTSWAKSKLFSRLSSMFLRQLSKNIKFGQPPPNAIPMKKADSGEASLEEDLFLTSPMEIVTQEDIILSDTENKPSDTPSSRSPLNLPGTRSEMEEKVAPVKPSRPKRHFSSAGTIESVNLDAIPLAIARLDNSAAKHKLSVKPKNQRVSKKHRRLARDRPNEQGGLPRQLSLDQNGHSGEDKPIWHEEEPELLESEEEKRCQEEYWLELEAKCKRQKAEAAERRRLEEQRLQALERRLWEENRRQELLEEEGEDREGEETKLQLEAEEGQGKEEKQRLKEQSGQGQEWREQEEGRHLEAQEQAVWRGQEAERQRQLEEERELKELRRQEELEEQRRQEAEKQQREEEEQRQREEQQRLEEEQRQREEQRQSGEQQRLEEEQRRRDEEQRQREEQLLLEEEQRRLEKEQREKEEQGREEEEEEATAAAERRAELGKREEVEVPQRPVAERREAARGHEEKRPQLEDLRGWRSALQVDSAEKPGKREHLQLEKQRENSEESRICEKQSREAEPSGEQQAQRGDLPWHGRRARQDKRPESGPQPPQKQEAPVEETPAPGGEKEAAAPETDRKVEELRWQEVDERQTMPRPYTFQVSSGGKQILFPKVNLSPVTPVTEAGPAPAAHEPGTPRPSPAPPALPSSLGVPHTAILVTGAQLCGPAVNLSQIKDTACKSLLGLSEERRRADGPGPEQPPRAAEPRAGSGKARAPESAAAGPLGPLGPRWPSGRPSDPESWGAPSLSGAATGARAGRRRSSRPGPGGIPAGASGRRQKPVLQSRHSLDGSKLAEKVETAQPLWITLALQKQKGFREQQATREERKQAREAKQAEKLSKENVSVSLQPGSSGVSRAGAPHKPTTQLEEKKPETAATRLERREQLKKANTLPTSVTVEISDSAPPTPLVKEVTKRFSTPDAAPVSTEPAWLALAKRKAKAWSDCPQIIK